MVTMPTVDTERTETVLLRTHGPKNINMFNNYDIEELGVVVVR